MRIAVFGGSPWNGVREMRVVIHMREISRCQTEVWRSGMCQNMRIFALGPESSS